jgi:hypothetical protein
MMIDPESQEDCSSVGECIVSTLLEILAHGHAARGADRNAEREEAVSTLLEILAETLWVGMDAYTTDIVSTLLEILAVMILSTVLALQIVTCFNPS